MRRLRRSVKKRIVFGVACIIVQVLLFGVYRFTVGYGIEKKYEGLLEEQETLLKGAGRMVYVTRQEVKAGEYFTEENVERKYLLCEQNPETLAAEAIGRIACADMSAGTIVSTYLCSAPEYAETERECVFYDIGCVEYFEAYAAVDVRIRYANGENYCVLKKKRLQNTEEDGEACRFFLSEEEQLFMSAAQYDTEVYEGAELYVVGFVEERLQQDAVSRYLPPVQVIAQLTECNVGEASSFALQCEQRLALEQRLAEHRRQRREGLL